MGRPQSVLSSINGETDHPFGFVHCSPVLHPVEAVLGFFSASLHLLYEDNC